MTHEDTILALAFAGVMVVVIATIAWGEFKEWIRRLRR